MWIIGSAAGLWPVILFHVTPAKHPPLTTGWPPFSSPVCVFHWPSAHYIFFHSFSASFPTQSLSWLGGTPPQEPVSWERVTILPRTNSIDSNCDCDSQAPEGAVACGDPTCRVPPSLSRRSEPIMPLPCEPAKLSRERAACNELVPHALKSDALTIMPPRLLPTISYRSCIST